MATLTIRKISDKVWKHSPSDGNSYIISKLYIKSDGDNIRVCEFNGAIRAEYNFADIVVYSIGGGAETFTSSQEVMERLEALNYVGFFSDGEVTPSDFISSDVNNSLVLGTDSKLFVPEVDTADFLSSDETTYADATLPLSDTDELLVNQGGTWKKVDKSEIGGGGGATDSYLLYKRKWRSFQSTVVNTWRSPIPTYDVLDNQTISSFGTGTTPNSSFYLGASYDSIPTGYIVDSIELEISFADGTRPNSLQVYIDRSEVATDSTTNTVSNTINLVNQTISMASSSTTLKYIKSLTVASHSLPSLAKSFLQIAIRETTSSSMYYSVAFSIIFKKV